MKILDIQFKNMPVGEIEPVLERLSKKFITLAHRSSRIKLASARTLVFASFLNVEDFILDLLIQTEAL